MLFFTARPLGASPSPFGEKCDGLSGTQRLLPEGYVGAAWDRLDKLLVAYQAERHHLKNISAERHHLKMLSDPARTRTELIPDVSDFFAQHSFPPRKKAQKDNQI